MIESLRAARKICIFLCLVDSVTVPDYVSAQMLVLTFAVNNHLDKKRNAKAEAWEAA